MRYLVHPGNYKMAAAWRNAMQSLMKRNSVLSVPVRHKRVTKYKKRDTWKILYADEEQIPSFNERVMSMTKGDPTLHNIVDISQPIARPKRSSSADKEAEWRALRSTGDLEKQARLKQLKLPLDEVQKDWEAESAPGHIQAACDHYNIYKDTFGDAFFTPRKILKICYDDKEETDFVNPVYCGNILSPSQADKEPHIEFEADADTLWTLTMTTPDGHLTQNNQEVLHWFIANIPGGDVSQGDVLCNYLQPFPPRGTGLHRYIFLLYQQDKPIDFTAEKRPPNCTSLQDRTFNTYEFYREHQDDITPVSVGFFQSDHDDSVKEVFHHVLEMDEPTYEYDFPDDWHPKQKHVPHKEPFNLYLDRYRDKKDIAEQVLKERLEKISPFEQEKIPKYPGIYSIPDSKTSWQKTEEYNKRLRLMQWKDL